MDTDLNNPKKSDKPKAVSPLNGQPVPTGGGRPKGSVNKSTETIKRAIADLLENNAQNIETWIKEVHDEDGAKDALKIYLDFAEFVTPKLTRAAVDHGGSVEFNINVLKFSENNSDGNNTPE
jgi:hypothetical protein